MTANINSFAASFRGFRDRIRNSHAKPAGLTGAYAARAHHLSITDRDLKDAAMARDDALGQHAHQPDLPFFLQSDFQTHRR